MKGMMGMFDVKINMGTRCTNTIIIHKVTTDEINKQ